MASAVGGEHFWAAIGAIGEVVGAIAVVVSLLYLAVQIRSQNRESRMTAAHEILNAFRTMQMPLQNPQLAALWHRAVLDFNGLDDAERLQVFAIVGPMLRVWEEAFVQFRGGRLDDETWEMMLAQYTDLMTTECFRFFWSKRRHVHSRRFAVYVDSLARAEGNAMRSLYSER